MSKWQEYRSGGTKLGGSATDPFAPTFLGGGGGGRTRGGIGGGGATASGENKATDDRIEISVDLSDPGKLISDFAGFAGEVASRTPLGIALGGAGTALGAVGSVPLPSFQLDKNREAPTVGDILPMAGEIFMAPGRALQRGYAKERLERRREVPAGPKPEGGGLFSGETFERMRFEEAEAQAVPPDLIARMDAGESIDDLAEEMIQRGAGFSNNPWTQLLSELVLDPMNLILPGAGKGIRGAKAAANSYDAAVAKQLAGEAARIGLSEATIGATWSTLSKGMSKGQASAANRVFGPMTDGVVQSFGVRSYRQVASGTRNVSQGAGDAWERSGATANAHLQRSMLWEKSYTHATEEIGAEAAKVRATKEVVGTRAEGYRKAYNPRRLTQETRVYADRLKPTLVGIDDAELPALAVQRHAAITGLTPEESAQALGKMTREKAVIVQHHAFGRGVDILESAKSLAYGDPGKVSAESIGRMTLIGERQFTRARIDKAIKSLQPKKPGHGVVIRDPKEIADELVKQYEPLAERFYGVNYTVDDVLKALDEIKKTGGLPETLVTKKKMPPSILTAREDLRALGYDIALEPADGMRSFYNTALGLQDKMPWVPLVGAATSSVTVRNRLGQFVDDAFRGIDQRLIVTGATRRAIEGGRGTWSESEARTFIRAVVNHAREASTSPRGLHVYELDDLARRSLGMARFNEMMQVPGRDPTWLVMHAFEGDLRTVGLTQKATGKIKTAGAPRSKVRTTRTETVEGVEQRTPTIRSASEYRLAGLVERDFPRLRWGYSPLFQHMERFESWFFNAIRGIRKLDLDEDHVLMWQNLVRHNEQTFNTLEAAHTIMLRGGEPVDALLQAPNSLGRKVSKVVMSGDVRDSKTQRMIRQAAFEHPEDFKTWVNDVGPHYWKIMEDAYGTKDPREIASLFFRERMDWANGNTTAINKAFDDAGGAFKSSADMETVWNGFRLSMERNMEKAFTTHFFRQSRSWFERTINHVFFGLYPSSYMLGKVLPEYARFLLLRPFGLNAPLTGQLALMKVHESLQVQTATNPDFESFLKDHAGSLYIMHQLMPGDPTDLSAGLSAPAEHTVKAVAGGDVTTLPGAVSRDVSDIFGRQGIPKTLMRGSKMLGEVSRDVNDWLSEAEKLSPPVSTPQSLPVDLGTTPGFGY